MKPTQKRSVPAYVFWFVALVCLVVLARRTRLARLRSASVTAVLPGPPAVASVALSYTGGLAPISAIVEVCGPQGSGGSATIDGRQRFAELPIAGQPEQSYNVTVTTFYRLLGVLRSDTCTFAGPPAATVGSAASATIV